MRTTFICREDFPGGQMAGFCPRGSVITTRRHDNIAFFSSFEEARRFIIEHLPGGLRNWTVERL